MLVGPSPGNRRFGKEPARNGRLSHRALHGAAHQWPRGSLQRSGGGTSGAADAAATAVIDVAGIAGVGKTKIIADSTANLGADCVALGNLSATLNEGGYAFDTTTGKLYYDADGDFSAGVVCVGTFYSTALGGANTALGVVAAADFLFTT